MRCSGGVETGQATRAARRLGRADLAPLVDELARRFGDGGEPAVLVLRGLSDRSRQALADLFGLDRLPAGIVRVRVGRLTDVLGLPSSTAELRAVVEELRGPLPDHRAASGGPRPWASRHSPCRASSADGSSTPPQRRVAPVLLRDRAGPRVQQVA